MTPRRPSISRALASAFKACPADPRGEAVAALARRLAVDLDAATDPDVVAKLSARLLPTLEALGMTRTAVAGVAKGGVPDGISALDELRAKRAALGQG